MGTTLKQGGSVADSPRFCSDCGFSLAPGAHFCPACGTKVEGAEPGGAPAVRPAEPPPAGAETPQPSESGDEPEGGSKGSEDSLGAATKSFASSCLLILGGIGLLLFGLPLIGLSFAHGFEPPLFGLGVLATLIGIALFGVLRKANTRRPPTAGGAAGE